MFLYYNKSDFVPSMTPEGMMEWVTYFKNLGDKLVDGGNPFGMRKFVSDPVADCSFVVSGYSIVKADSFDDAVLLAEGHPHLKFGKLEVVEMVEMSMADGSSTENLA